jgi:hypothetical protein
MKKTLLMLTVLISLTASAWAQGPKYPPISEYMMPQDAEVDLAKSAAPANISDRATIKLLTTSGYHVTHNGDNDFVCIVMRGWGAPTFSPAPLRDMVYDAKVRAPICFNPVASRTVLPIQELRTKLGLEGKTPNEITEAVQAAYAKGELPKVDIVAFAYMFSADQYLGSAAGHWHPHMMVYTPYYQNSMLGGNPPGGVLPVVGDDAGTPFAVTVIPVDVKLAIKVGSK